MSRGLGAMQRDILRAFEAPDTPSPLVPAGVKRYNWLRMEVAKLRGVWCETDCRPNPDPFKGWRKPHTPHLALEAHLQGFEVAFARALRSLITRGILEVVDDDGYSFPVWRYDRIPYVKRAKCLTKELNT